MSFPRRCGILLHPTSLPSRFGIGDLGDGALHFVDFLRAAGQSYWQVLPLTPTGYANSPYQGLSAFAGNPMLISPERLLRAGHLSRADLADIPSFPDGRVDYGQVNRYKTGLLARAFSTFRSRAPASQRVAFRSFCEGEAPWLDDFALFMALKEAHGLRPWPEWDSQIASRQSEAMDHFRTLLAEEIESHKYRQWQFFEQWATLKRTANENGIRIIGDIPFFVSLDSPDVWANPHLFYLNESLQPTVVSGVPPDYFSETGQLWGHPLYRWDEMESRGYTWWVDRFRAAFAQADVVRIDHFRAFHNYWEVPAGSETAADGNWRYGPGAGPFEAIVDALDEVAVIAEDLGDFDDESRAGVDSLQRGFGFPGLKVLQFAFGAGSSGPFLPHNFGSECVVYTGTHDNDTILGWYHSTSSEAERGYARQYVGSDGSEIAWDMIRLAWASVADTAITTAQDLLCLDHQARLNTPGTVGPPNWCWRFTHGALTRAIAARLLDLTEVYGRAARPGAWTKLRCGQPG